MLSASRPRFRLLVGLVAIVSIGGAVLFGGRTFGQEKTLVLASYGGTYQEDLVKAFVQPFEQETGVKVTVVPSFAAAKVKAMVSVGKVEWDVLDMSYSTLIQLEKEGLLEKLDYGLLNQTEVKNLLPDAVHPYAVGVYYWSTVMAYDKRAFPSGKYPRSWADFWDVKNFPGPRAFWGPYSPTSPVCEFALLADGVKPSELNRIDMDRCFKSLERIKPHVTKWWKTGAEFVQLLANREVAMINVWPGRIYPLIDKGEPIGIEWNEGNATIQVFGITKGSKNRELAHKLLDYLIRPKLQGDFAVMQLYGPSNKGAYGFLSPQVAERLSSHPDRLKQQFIRNAEWWAQKGQGEKTHYEILQDRFNQFLLR
jgi:putative spermidine/putrescine transport system substrate-binding protein